MNHLAPQFARKGLIALSLSAALGAHAAWAQSDPRALLAAETPAASATVSASLETFPAASDIGQLKGASQPLLLAIEFLRTYYKLGRGAQRDELLKLYAPDMQPALSRQFTDTKTVAAAFADLGQVDVDAALSWGSYRVVLVNHHARSNPKQVFPWVHTLDCQARCVFVQEPELMQKASYLFYLTRYGKENAAAPQAKGASLKLALYPVFSDKPAVPGLTSNPLELNLLEADAAGKAAGTALLARLLKYPDAGTALAEAEKNLFDGGTPRAYPRKAGDGKSVDLVSWAAYIERVRSKSWPTVNVYRLRADSAIVIARAENNDVLLLPLHRTGNGWRLFSSPSQAPFWPLFEGRPFADAFGKLHKKP